MKVGDRVRVKNLDFWKNNQGEVIKRSKKLIDGVGKVIDINLGIFKVEFPEIDNAVEYFDGRELQMFDTYEKQQVDLVFVSWQQKGKSVYNKDEYEWLFTGDLHRGVVFKAIMELGEEEVDRIKRAEKEGIKPVFDLVIQDADRRKNRREIKES
jgi:hypothetical protein